jgi:hypothetical protein
MTNDFDKSKAIREAAKARQRIAYTERKAGKGFREIGQILGCSASRAREIYEKAARSANAGWLFPVTHPNRIMP